MALALCGAVYKNGFVKNKVLEFVGPGIGEPAHGLPHRHRRDDHRDRLPLLHLGDRRRGGGVSGHPRAGGGDYAPLHPEDGAYYDSLITIDLSCAEPMAALPFHPSEALPLRELIENPGDVLRQVELRAAEQFGGKAALT